MKRLKTIADIHQYAEKIRAITPDLSSPENLKLTVTLDPNEFREFVKPFFTVQENILQMLYNGVEGVEIIIKCESLTDKFSLMMERINNSHHSKGHLKRLDA